MRTLTFIEQNGWYVSSYTTENDSHYIELIREHDYGNSQLKIEAGIEGLEPVPVFVADENSEPDVMININLPAGTTVKIYSESVVIAGVSTDNE